MRVSKSILCFVVALLLFKSEDVFSQVMVERIMTIQELATSIEKNNIQIKLGNTAVKVAEARVEEVKNNRLPDISADMSAFYLSDVAIYDTKFKKLQTVNLPNFGQQINLSASQLLSAGGKINRSIALANLNKTLSSNQLTDTEQQIKLNGAELYLQLYNLQHQKEILENNRKLAVERTRYTKLFLEQDMVTKNELLRAQVLERQLEQSILQAQNAILITNKSLAILAGVADNVLIVATIDNINHQIRDQNEFFYQQAALQKNTKIVTSSTQVTIAEQNLQLTKADRLPVLAAFSGYNVNRPQTSGTPADLYSNSYQAGLRISYNIESLYKNPKKEAVDRILIDQARQSKEAVKQQVEADVNAAYKNYQLAVQQLEVSALNAEAAAENYRITELKYNNKLVTYIEIIDAANTKLQAELQLLDDQTNIILNYVRLLRVTGQL